MRKHWCLIIGTPFLSFAIKLISCRQWKNVSAKYENSVSMSVCVYACVYVSVNFNRATFWGKIWGITDIYSTLLQHTSSVLWNQIWCMLRILLRHYVLLMQIIPRRVIREWHNNISAAFFHIYGAQGLMTVHII